MADTVWSKRCWGTLSLSSRVKGVTLWAWMVNTKSMLLTQELVSARPPHIQCSTPSGTCTAGEQQTGRRQGTSRSVREARYLLYIVHWTTLSAMTGGWNHAQSDASTYTFEAIHAMRFKALRGMQLSCCPCRA